MNRERLADEAVWAALDGLPGWSREGDVLVRSVRRRDWRSAIALVDAVAQEADRRDHHPDLCVTGYRNVTFRLSTHSAGGITARDVELAERIEELVGADGQDEDAG